MKQKLWACEVCGRPIESRKRTCSGSCRGKLRRTQNLVYNKRHTLTIDDSLKEQIIMFLVMLDELMIEHKGLKPNINLAELPMALEELKRKRLVVID